MSEDSATYTAKPGEAFQGELISLRTAAPTLRVRLNFGLMAKGNVQPEATIELDGIPADEAVPDAVLADIGVIGAKVLRIATILGKRWEWAYKNGGPRLPSENPDPTVDEFKVNMWLAEKAMMIADREEIEGWLVERVSPPQPA